MESVETLIVGAGVSGLALAAALGSRDYLVLEADREIGGYCKTVHRDGFVWDYSGHFFHFRHPEIEAWLRARMAGQRIHTVHKRAFISYAGRWIDFPFQKNIHQLPQEDFIECLHDVYFARASAGPRAPSFQQLLCERYGRAICEKFLFPYNEKLYACDLETLDPDAMGRFFPHADLDSIVRNMRSADNASYNSTFTYPEQGAFEYVRAIAAEVRPAALALAEPLVGLDLDRHLARTPRRLLSYGRLVSSIPFNRLAALCGLAHDEAAFRWNKVLVFNLGFDRKGPRDVHWLYHPDRARVFYRTGFYDNIFDTERMSLYVEIGLPAGAAVDVEALLGRTLQDLGAEGIVDGHRLVAHHAVVMEPAYVHLTPRGIAEHRRLAALLAEKDVYSIGRYGGWTYCSIEDNLVEARALASRL